MRINQKLLDGTCEIAELIESLRRFPQGAKVRINRNMIAISPNVTEGDKRLYFLDDDIPEKFWT